MKFHLDFGKIEDFTEFSKIQYEILPDVQKIDKNGFEALVENQEIIFVKDEISDIAGFAIVKDHGNYGLLRQLAVADDFRRRGVASYLVQAAENWFEQRNIKKIHIMVKAKNDAAIKLYQKFNYYIELKNYQYIIELEKFNKIDYQHSIEEICLETIKLEDHAVISHKYNISHEELLAFQEVTSSINLGVYQNTQIIGFLRLRPKFPVLTPIIIDDYRLILPVLKLIQKYTSPEFDFLKITFSGEKLYDLIDQLISSTLNFIIVRMIKVLEF